MAHEYKLYDGDKRVQYMETAIEDTPVYRNTSKICKGEFANHTHFLTALVGSLVGVAYIDQQMDKREVKYLKKYVASWLNMEPELIDKMVDLNVFVVKNHEYFLEDVNIFIDYLTVLLDNKQKEKFITTLFLISRSDLNTSASEMSYIHDVSKKFELPEDVFQLLARDSDRLLRSELQKLHEKGEAHQGLYIMRGKDIWDID